jgi:uncharacterized membrane protein
MTIDEQTPTPARRWSWMQILLGLSLALNLFVAGAAVTVAWKHKGGGPGGRGGFDLGLGRFAQELGGEKGKAVRDAVKSVQEQGKPMRETIRQAWDDANASLASEPFDRAKVDAAYQKLSTAENDLKALLRNKLIDLSSTLTAEERARLVAFRAKRMGKRGRGDGPPMMP